MFIRIFDNCIDCDCNNIFLNNEYNSDYIITQIRNGVFMWYLVVSENNNLEIQYTLERITLISRVKF